MENVLKKTSPELLTRLLYETPAQNSVITDIDFLIDSTVQLLILDPPFRSITCKTLCQMLMTILDLQRANNKEINPTVTAEILKAYKFYIDN
jgi:hypothetical protein